MGLCSCTPTCACALHAKSIEDGGSGLITVTGNGNPAEGGWEVDVLETPFAAANVDGTLSIIPGGAYGHGPTFNMRLLDSPTVDLVATPDGLQAHVIDAPSGVGGVPTGVMLPYWGDSSPSGFLMCSGPNYSGYVAQSAYPELFAVIGHKGSNGVNPGNGTFAIPNMDDRVPVGLGTWGGLGTPGGAAAVALAVSELATHSHGSTGGGGPVTLTGNTSNDSSGSVTVSGTTNEEPNHQHAGAGADHRFLVENNSHTDVYVEATLVQPTAGRYIRFTQNGSMDDTGTAVIHLPSRELNTKGSGSHDHTVSATGAADGTHGHSVSVSGAIDGVTILDSGGGDAHENRQPFMVTNYIIKT